MCQNEPLSNISPEEDEISTYIKLEECPTTVNIPKAVSKVGVATNTSESAAAKEVKCLYKIVIIVTERKSSEKVE